MIARKQRRPPGRILYIVFWVGAVWIGLGFLGTLPHLIPDFLRDYSRDRASAFEVLAGEMIVFAIGVLCILEIVDANKTRREQTTGARRETDAPSPEPLPPPSPASNSPEHTSPAILNQLKEELFSLESDRVSGKITQEEYSEAKAAIETRLKLATGGSIPDSIPPAPPEHEQEQAPTVPKKTSLWFTVPILAVLCWTAFIVFRREGISAYAVGEVTGTLLIPFLIAYAVAGVKRRRNWGLFSVVFFGVGVFLSGATNQKSLSGLSHPDMVKELLGAKPLEDNLPESEKEMALATRAVFANLAAFRVSHDEQLKALEPELGQLYTGESFARKEAMQRTLDVVDKKISLDRETSVELEQMPKLVSAQLDQTSLSASQKRDYLKGFMEKFSGSEFISARQQAMVAESDWADSTHDLYAFAIQHASQIVANKDSIGIGSEPIREKFNEKFTRSRGLFDKYFAAAKKADAVRSENLKSQGLSEADLGLNK